MDGIAVVLDSTRSSFKSIHLYLQQIMGNPCQCMACCKMKSKVKVSDKFPG